MADAAATERRCSRRLSMEDGCDLCYSDVGDPKGHVVICVPGLAFKGDRRLGLCFDDLAKRHQVRLICLQIQGHRTDGWLVDGLVALISSLGISRAVLIGQSTSALETLSCSKDPRLGRLLKGSTVHLISPWLSDAATISTAVSGLEDSLLKRERFYSNYSSVAYNSASGLPPVPIFHVSSAEAATLKMASTLSASQSVYRDLCDKDGSIKTNGAGIIKKSSPKNKASNERQKVASSPRKAHQNLSKSLKEWEGGGGVCIYHGQCDELVSCEEVRECVRGLQNVSLFVKPGGTHALMFDLTIVEKIFISAVQNLTQEVRQCVASPPGKKQEQAHSAEKRLMDEKAIVEIGTSRTPSRPELQVDVAPAPPKYEQFIQQKEREVNKDDAMVGSGSTRRQLQLKIDTGNQQERNITGDDIQQPVLQHEVQVSYISYGPSSTITTTTNILETTNRNDNCISDGGLHIQRSGSIYSNENQIVTRPSRRLSSHMPAAGMMSPRRKSRLSIHQMDIDSDAPVTLASMNDVSRRKRSSIGGTCTYSDNQPVETMLQPHHQEATDRTRRSSGSTIVDESQDDAASDRSLTHPGHKLSSTQNQTPVSTYNGTTSVQPSDVHTASARRGSLEDLVIANLVGNKGVQAMFEKKAHNSFHELDNGSTRLHEESPNHNNSYESTSDIDNSSEPSLESISVPMNVVIDYIEPIYHTLYSKPSADSIGQRARIRVFIAVLVHALIAVLLAAVCVWCLNFEEMARKVRLFGKL